MKFPPFCGHRWDGGWWFRIYGYGLRCSDRTKREALFSERAGLVRVLRVGKWSIAFLSPSRSR